jgi:DNA-binding ferritin-like protein
MLSPFTSRQKTFWHLYGSHFRDYHLLFDEHGEAIFESIDVMAERVRRVGGTTIRSIRHIGQLQTIEDDNSTVMAAEEMVRILMEDNGHIAKMIREAIETCDKNRDSATSNQLQNILDQIERRKWFLIIIRIYPNLHLKTTVVPFCFMLYIIILNPTHLPIIESVEGSYGVNTYDPVCLE